MRKGKHSRTAESAAAFRAAHYLYDKTIIFNDPYADKMLGPALRIALSNKYFYKLFFQLLLRPIFRPSQAHIVGRCRYAEDCLENTLKEGVSQYLIIGAGLDTFSLRRPDLAKALTIYEVDHPDTQQFKINKINKFMGNTPQNVNYIPLDHETGSFSEALTQSSLDLTNPTFISWLGTTPYLSVDAIKRTLRDISSLFGAGTTIVFDYGIATKLMKQEDLTAVKKLQKITAAMGEPLTFEIEPATFFEEVKELGYQCLDDLNSDDYKSRYFEDRSDDLKPIGGSNFCRLGLV